MPGVHLDDEDFRDLADAVNGPSGSVERVELLERALREIAAWQNMEGVGGQAIRLAREVLGHCPTCGKERAPAECASCEQWWRDNPPPPS